MKYAYSAVFSPINNKKIMARVPDLPGCVTSGKDLFDAIEQITDAASGWLVVAEDAGDPIPVPTPQSDIAHEAEEILSIVQMDTLAFRAATDTRSVRKNVSLPAWMATLAEKRGVSCSQVLQEGLMKKLS